MFYTSIFDYLKSSIKNIPKNKKLFLGIKSEPDRTDFKSNIGIFRKIKLENFQLKNKTFNFFG